jgi:hypothetical protein
VRVAGRGPRVAAALALLVLAGCGGGSEAPPTATPPASVTESTSTPGALDPGVAVELVVQACRAKDADRLRGLVAADLSEGQIAVLFGRGDDVLLLARGEPAFDGDRATVSVTLEVNRTGGSEVIERRWELVQGADGAWRLSQLPDCY